MPASAKRQHSPSTIRSSAPYSMVLPAGTIAGFVPRWRACSRSTSASDMGSGDRQLVEGDRVVAEEPAERRGLEAERADLVHRPAEAEHREVGAEQHLRGAVAVEVADEA